MAWLLVVAALQSAVSGVLGMCGDTVLSQDFNSFGGNYEYWSDSRGGCAIISFSCL